MDKNIPAAGGELAPVVLTFVASGDAAEASSSPAMAEKAVPVEDDADPATKNQRLREAGEQVMEMLNPDQEGMKPKSAISMAAEAFTDAGKKKGK